MLYLIKVEGQDWSIINLAWLILQCLQGMLCVLRITTDRSSENRKRKVLLF